MDALSIPDDFWKHLSEDAKYPMAGTDLNQKFIWVNNAFEELVGYRRSELKERTWMSITDPKDVGDDLQNVQLLIEGKLESYTMFKDYVHKKGHLVPVELTVRIFPVTPDQPLVCFRVEAPLAKVTRPELDSVKNECFSHIQELREQMASFNANNSFNKSEHNSNKAIKYMIGGVVAMTLFGTWMFYYMATLNKPTINPTPPPGITHEP